MFVSVTQQLKRALSAVKSVLAFAGTAAAALDPRLGSFLRDGERLDGVESLLLAVVRWLQGDHDRLEGHEAAQRRALRWLKRLRDRRDRKQETLYSRLLRIRTTFEDAFGRGKAAIYLGLEPRLGDLEPQALRRLAKETVDVLTDPSFTTPEPVVQGLWENPARYAEQILEALDPFQTSLDEIAAQSREVEKAQKAKNDLLDELGERLKWSIRLFEAVYQLADLGFHAERLRLTVSARPSAEDTAGKPDGDEEADAGGPQPAAAAQSPDVESDA